MAKDIQLKKIKLIIWDLDDTFWNGTLSEEGIDLVPKNIKIVKELTDRGIINSICSKNTEYDVYDVLNKHKLSYYFVFNKISWSPKGLQIKNTLTEMALRAENTLFIDDNLNNLNEVKAQNPGINVFHPNEILDELLDLECTKGKNDVSHSRLNQYKNLEKKVTTKKTSNLSNIEFLKKCNIKVKIDYDCLSHIDRIYELIERTNQLNYTKCRINSTKDKNEFLNKINSYKYNAGVISCSDDFGDYGVVGFFLVKQDNSNQGFLEHFVFSCRVINMGIEYFIYDYLNKPVLNTAVPVAYSIDNYSMVDWVTLVDDFKEFESENSTILVGPCHLLQLSNFFKTELNFVQYNKSGSIVKFDCPTFFLGKKEDLEKSSFLSEGYTWTLNEYLSFHLNLKTTKLLIISLEDIISDRDYIFDSNCLFRYEGIEKCTYKTVKLNLDERIKILFDILNYLSDTMLKDSQIVVLDSIINNNTPSNLKGIRLVYSHILHKHFNNKLIIVDTNIYAKNTSSDGVHLDRESYFNIYKDIKGNKINKSLTDYTLYDNSNNYTQIFYNLRLRFIRSFGSRSYLYKIVYNLKKLIKI